MSVATESLPKVEWSGMIWFKGNIRKHSCCSWLAIQKGLKTKSLLHSRGIISAEACSFCGHTQEDEEHLFIHCSFSSHIWERIAVKFGVGHPRKPTIVEQMKEFLAACDHSKEGNSTLASLCFPAFIWHVWRERNNRIFNFCNKPWEAILNEVLNEVRAKAIFLNMDTSPILAAAWNLTANEKRHLPSMVQSRFSAIWDVIISSQAGYSVRFLKDSHRAGCRVRSAECRDPFEEAYLIILDAAQIRRVRCIWFDNASVRDGIKDLICSPWRSRMFSQKASKLFYDLNLSGTNSIELRAKSWIKLAPSLRSSNQWTRLA